MKHLLALDRIKSRMQDARGALEVRNISLLFYNSPSSQTSFSAAKKRILFNFQYFGPLAINRECDQKLIGKMSPLITFFSFSLGDFAFGFGCCDHKEVCSELV